MAHELLRLLVNRLGVDQQFADVRVEVVADRADHQAGFLVDQVGAALQLRRVLDRMPQLQQVVHVPLQLLGRAADARGAGDDAHAVGHFEAVDRVAQFVALLALDAARNAAAARIVRHQDEVAPGQRDVGGQRRALVAALVLVHLDDQFLAFPDLVLDPRTCRIAVTVAEEVAGNFLERQETVAVGAVVDEAGFERRFDAGDDCLVDVALALFLGCGFDVEVDEFLTIDDRHPEFLRLGGIEQHAFHGLSRKREAPRGAGGRSRARREMPRRLQTLCCGGRRRRRRCGQAVLPAGEGGARRCGCSLHRAGPMGIGAGGSRRINCLQRVNKRYSNRAADPAPDSGGAEVRPDTKILALGRRAMRRFEPAAAGCGDCAHHLPSLLLRENPDRRATGAGFFPRRSQNSVLGVAGPRDALCHPIRRAMKWIAESLERTSSRVRGSATIISE